jgi:hypothetical protein
MGLVGLGCRVHAFIFWFVVKIKSQDKIDKIDT